MADWQYRYDAAKLLLKGDISWQTFKHALREEPPAVAGRGANFIIDRKTASDFFDAPSVTNDNLSRFDKTRIEQQLNRDWRNAPEPEENRIAARDQAERAAYAAQRQIRTNTAAISGPTQVDRDAARQALAAPAPQAQKRQAMQQQIVAQQHKGLPL